MVENVDDSVSEPSVTSSSAVSCPTDSPKHKVTDKDSSTDSKSSHVT